MTTKIDASMVDNLPLLTVSSVEELRNIGQPKEGVVVCVQGYYAPEDNGGGNFIWSSTSVDPVNGGTVLGSISSPSGRWKRESTDGLSIRHFGAIGSDTNIPVKLSDKFSTLQDAQEYYPTVAIESLDQSVDWASTQSAIDTIATGVMIIPKGTFIYTDQLLSTNRAVTWIGEGPGYIRSNYFAPQDTKSCSRLLFIGTGKKQTLTRYLYRGADTDPADPTLSAAINIQNEGFIGIGFMVELYCDYSDTSPSNLGDNWDVGIFNGCRMDMRLIDVNVLGYWREAAIWLDATRGVHLPELNNYPTGTAKGADGISFERVTTLGGKWGIRKQGPRPKSNLLHFGFQYKSAAKITFGPTVAEGNSVTIGTETFVFKTTPVLKYDVAIGASVAESVSNLVKAWQTVFGRLVPYDALTLSGSSNQLEVFSTSTSASAISTTVPASSVTDITGTNAVTQTDPITNYGKFYDFVNNTLVDDGRNSLGASDFVVNNSVIYSIEHHSGQAITTASGDPQNDEGAGGAMWIDGLGGSAVIHRQFFNNTRFHSREPYNIKLGSVGRYRQTNCTQDGSPPFTYGRTVTSPIKSAIIQIIGYDDPGTNFSHGLNNNQLYTGFKLEGYDVEAHRNLQVGGSLIVGSNNSGSDVGIFQLKSGESSNVELRLGNSLQELMARIRSSASGGLTFAIRQGPTGTLNDCMFMSNSGTTFYNRVIPSASGHFLGNSTNMWGQVHSNIGYYVNNKKIIGEQQPAIADLSTDPTAANYNALLTVLRSHGLIAT